jgi:ATP synthase in type III secretion protein N
MLESEYSILNDIDVAPCFYPRVIEVSSTLIYVKTDYLSVGDLCYIYSSHNSNAPVLAEMIAFNEDLATLAPLGSLHGVSNQSYIIPTGRFLSAPCSEELLGRVVDFQGRSLLKTVRPLQNIEHRKLYSRPPNPLSRIPVEHQCVTGIKCLDILLPCGYGQRMGIFATAGGGKSTLTQMLTNYVEADVLILALIGERGREVNEFFTQKLNPNIASKTIIVAATSDSSALEKIYAANYAVALCEYFRDQSKDAVLVFDSITRYCRALREIGLASGEPTTPDGYTPSVYESLPKLLERCTNSDKGTITSFFNVLVDDDQKDDRLSDEVKSILDGHIYLSNKLASRGIYPAVDLLRSASRLIGNLLDDEEMNYVSLIKQLIARYNELEILIKVGEYQRGQDEFSDQAVDKKHTIEQFIKQSINESFKIESSRQLIKEIFNE